MEMFANLIALLKLPVRFAVALAIVSGASLFAPDGIINKLGFLKYRELYRPYIGAVLLVSIVIILTAAVGAVIDKYEGHRFQGKAQKRLGHLTNEEKQILGRYIFGRTKSLDLSIQSGVVKGLVAEFIIFRSSSVSTNGLAFAHNIQPWAWDYLNEHPELLSPD